MLSLSPNLPKGEVGRVRSLISTQGGGGEISKQKRQKNTAVSAATEKQRTVGKFPGVQVCSDGDLQSSHELCGRNFQVPQYTSQFIEIKLFLSQDSCWLSGTNSPAPHSDHFPQAIPSYTGQGLVSGLGSTLQVRPRL